MGGQRRVTAVVSDAEPMGLSALRAPEYPFRPQSDGINGRHGDELIVEPVMAMRALHNSGRHEHLHQADTLLLTSDSFIAISNKTFLEQHPACNESIVGRTYP
jgi:hypothetical protein